MDAAGAGVDQRGQGVDVGALELGELAVAEDQLGDIEASLGADDEEVEDKAMLEDGALSPQDAVAEELVGRSLASELEAA